MVLYYIGGADRARTDDLLHAMQALFQLSYGPVYQKMGQGRRAESKLIYTLGQWKISP